MWKFFWGNPLALSATYLAGTWIVRECSFLLTLFCPFHLPPPLLLSQVPLAAFCPAAFRLTFIPNASGPLPPTSHPLTSPADPTTTTTQTSTTTADFGTSPLIFDLLSSMSKGQLQSMLSRITVAGGGGVGAGGLTLVQAPARAVRGKQAPHGMENGPAGVAPLPLV